MNLQSLASVIGQGLIAAVLPGIQALNALMSKLMQAAETFRNFMYVLMGKKIKGSTSGVVNDLAGLEDSATDLSGLQDAGDAAASGLDDATSSAKTLKKALSVLPFDELNQLTDNSSSSGSTPGTGKGKTGTGTTPSLGLGGITDQIDDALNKEETPINKWAEKSAKLFLTMTGKDLERPLQICLISESGRFMMLLVGAMWGRKSLHFVMRSLDLLTALSKIFTGIG